MKCSRCGRESDLVIHSRAYRIRTKDYYVRYWCRSCKRARNNPECQQSYKISSEWLKRAYEINGRIMTR